MKLFFVTMFVFSSQFSWATGFMRLSPEDLETIPAFFGANLELIEVDTNDNEKTIARKVFCTKQQLTIKSVLWSNIWISKAGKSHNIDLELGVAMTSIAPRIIVDDLTGGSGSGYIQVFTQFENPRTFLFETGNGIKDLNSNFMGYQTTKHPVLFDEGSHQGLMLKIGLGSAYFDKRTKKTYLRPFFREDGDIVDLNNCSEI